MYETYIKEHYKYGSLYLACNDRKAFFTTSKCHYVRMYATPYPISWVIFILDSEPKLYRQIVESRCVQIVPLLRVPDLFLYCYERDFMDSHDNQADVIEAFNSTSRYLDDLLNIDNPYFEDVVKKFIPLNYS